MVRRKEHVRSCRGGAPKEVLRGLGRLCFVIGSGARAAVPGVVVVVVSRPIPVFVCSAACLVCWVGSSGLV